jgi:hypothetical protein
VTFYVSVLEIEPSELIDEQNPNRPCSKERSQKTSDNVSDVRHKIIRHFTEKSKNYLRDTFVDAKLAL